MKCPKHIRVLYIEDNKDHADFLTQLLSISKCVKFDIIIKATLKLGVDYLKSIECNIDVVLLDLVLSNSQGINTFQKVYEVCEKVPIVIISKHEDIAYECIALGAEDYLVKPDISYGLVYRSLVYAIERCKNRQMLKEQKQRFK